jgi:hypothetical protein
MKFFDDCGWVILAVAVVFMLFQVLRFLIKGVVG